MIATKALAHQLARAVRRNALLYPEDDGDHEPKKRTRFEHGLRKKRTRVFGSGRYQKSGFALDEGRLMGDRDRDAHC
jgi:hypothetical protein